MLALPVIAGFYATTNGHRISLSEDVSKSIAAVQRRHGLVPIGGNG